MRQPHSTCMIPLPKAKQPAIRAFHETPLGRIIHGDSRDVLPTCDDASVDLIMTSPPFGLVRKKAYGNVDAED